MLNSYTSYTLLLSSNPGTGTLKGKSHMTNLPVQEKTGPNRDVPELDGASAAVGLCLMIGMLLVMMGRRQKNTRAPVHVPVDHIKKSIDKHIKKSIDKL